MSGFLRWEQDREAFERCVTHRLLDPFHPVIYRDAKTRKIVIDLATIAYFKTNDDFFDYLEERGDKAPSWVRRSKDLQSFERTLRYVVEFLRRIEVYASTKELMNEYEKRMQPPAAPAAPAVPSADEV